MASSADTHATVHPVSVRHPSLATIAAAATSTTGESQSHNDLQNESEEMLMMFSTSPDSWANESTLRHSPLGPHSDHTGTGKNATTTELAAFSRDPYAISISQLVSDIDDEHSHYRHSSEYRLNTRFQSIPHKYQQPVEDIALSIQTSNLSSSSTQHDPSFSRASIGPEPVSPLFSSPAIDFSPTENIDTIHIGNQAHGIHIVNSSRRGPEQSYISPGSYDSFTTAVTSPSTSVYEPFPASPLQSLASTSNDKGKGRVPQVDDMAQSHSITTAHEQSPSTSFFQPQHLLLQASPEGLGHYFPDVADLLPPFELERKAFDWNEFERSLQASPGAGTSSGSPFSPIVPVAAGLGLSLSLPATNSTALNNITTQTSQSFPSPSEIDHEPSVTEGVSVRTDDSEPSYEPSTISVPAPSQQQGVVTQPQNEPPLPRAQLGLGLGDRRHTVSMFGTSRDSNRRSLIHRTNANAIDHEFGASRNRSEFSSPLSSRPSSIAASPRLKKKKSLTLPSWLSKVKDGKSSVSPGHVTPASDIEVGVGKEHRPRRLYKEKGKAHTVPFPYIISPESILLQAEESRVDENEHERVLPESAAADCKPVEEVSLFETVLPRETKMWVFVQLLELHQEEFEQRLLEGRWSSAHASRERWVGRDAGMRELIKLSRVSKSWQDLVLDGQLWQSFDLMAFPGLRTSLVLRLAQCAGAFVQKLNLQGHSTLKSSSILALSSEFSLPSSPFEHSLPTTQLTTINLVACVSITTHSLHYLLLRSPRLEHLFLRGLDSVTNTTLTEILAPHCPRLVSLDIRRCANVNGSGLLGFAGHMERRSLEKKNVAASLRSLKIAGMKGTTDDVMCAVGRAFPLLEALDVSYCRDLDDDCFRAFVEWPEPTVEVRHGVQTPQDWTRFGTGVELSSRDAGLDPADISKHWRRVTAIRHLNVSGCRHITDQTCTFLAFATPKLEFLEMAGIGSGLHEDGLIHLLKTTPCIRKLDLEDASDLTDAVLDCLVPEIRIPPTTSARQSRKEVECQPGEQLEHLVISCAMAVTPEAMTRLIRGCKKLRVFEADNTRITGSVMRDFVNRRRHREKGLMSLPEGSGSEIVGIDCRAVSENAIRDMNAYSRPRRGWRGWEARDLQYEDGASVGVTDSITGVVVVGSLIGQDECDERRVVVKSFHSWGEVDRVTEQRNKAKAGSTKEKNGELPRWLTNWSLGRRNTGTGTGQSLVGTPEEREDRGCIVQ